MIVFNADDFNNVSQEEYEIFLSHALPTVMDGACERCLASGFLIKWGTYRKTFCCIVPYNPQCCRSIRIQRIFCKNCRHTFSVLPDSVIPRIRFALKYLLMIIEDCISQQNKIETQTDLISKRTIRRYVKRFYEWNQKYRINILGVSQKKLRQFCIEKNVPFLCKPPPTQSASAIPPEQLIIDL